MKSLIVVARKPGDVEGQASWSTGDDVDNSWAAPAAPQRFFSFIGSDRTPASAARASTAGAPVGVSPSGSAGATTSITFQNTFTGSLSLAYENCIQAAENFLSTVFKPVDSATVTISFDEQALGAHTYFLTNSSPYAAFTTFAKLSAALPSSDVMPSKDPGGSTSQWYVPPAYGRLLGVSNFKPPSTSFDSEVHLNSDYAWNFNQDVIAGLIHEMTESVFGRVDALGQTNYGLTNSWTTLDLFRYTSDGVYDVTNGVDGKSVYFSSDGGKTINTAFPLNNQFTPTNTTTSNGVDSGDWIGNGQVFGGVTPQSTLSLAATEISVISALGFGVAMPEDFMEASGSWQDPTTWSMACMPIAEPEDAYIGGQPNVVDATLSANVTVNSIGTQAGDTLEIESNYTLKALNGTQINSATVGSTRSGNAGAMYVDAGAQLAVGGAFFNPGVLTIGGDKPGNIFPGYVNLLGSVPVVFSGGGRVHLGVDFPGGGSSTANVAGGGFTNVDNTIDGAGSIEVATFDNQAAGTIIATRDKGGAYLGPYLLIEAPTAANEGLIDVAANARLALGNFGASTLNNSGDVNVGWDGAVAGSGSQVMIDGTVTLSGTGSFIVRGAGAAIVSSYFDAATFVNNSNMSIRASAQIGDTGIFSGAGKLTFVNRGQLTAYGSGVVATLDTGALAIDDGGGLIEAVSAATLDINSDVTTGQSYATGAPALPGGTVEAITGGTIDLSASISAGPAAPAGHTLASGKVVVQYTGRLTILSGGSVSVPLSIYGPAGHFGAGRVMVQSGGSLSGPVTFGSAGAELDLTDVATAVSASGDGGVVTLTNSSIILSGGSETVDFVGAGNVATISAASSASDTVEGFGVGDTVAFAGLAYAATDFATFVGDGSGAGGTVTVDNAAGAALASFSVKGSYEPSQFALASLGGNLAVVGAAGLAHPAGADFDEDGRSDILWRNADGNDEIWAPQSSGGFKYLNPGSASTDWQVAGTGDFNGDGKADILWRNASSGDAYLYASNGSGAFNYVDFGVVSSSWQIAGVGDFNHDGLSDILWRNAGGDDEIWAAKAGGGFLYQNAGGVATDWAIVGVGDLDGDGKSDILWRDSSGDAETWLTRASGGYAYVNDGTISTDWQVAGLGDFNGDGKADILWRNATSGDAYLYQSNGSGGFGYSDLGVVSADWRIAEVGDFNGDGLSDILWRNANGADEIWSTKAGGGFTYLDAGAAPASWKIVG